MEYKERLAMYRAALEFLEAERESLRKEDSLLGIEIMKIKSEIDRMIYEHDAERRQRRERNHAKSI